MNVQILLPTKQKLNWRIDDENDPVNTLVKFLHTKLDMTAYGLFFQGSLLDENLRFIDLKLPKNALIVVDELDEPRSPSKKAYLNTRSVSSPRSSPRNGPQTLPTPPSESPIEEDAINELAEMEKKLGFSSFGTSKGKNHTESAKSGMRIKQTPNVLIAPILPKKRGIKK
jgi:U4/U6.U5 small nuclear ribonucleoproteins